MQRFLDYVTDLRLMLLVQGDQPRYRLVELHRKRVANGERSVLVGLQSFAEGLDLKGDLLSQVHIHKIAFPPIDSPVVITEGEWLKSLNRYPFEVQSLPSASFNLIQQVGRLIRSHGCWGEVVIYDKRLLTKNYGKRLLDALPVFPIEQPEVPEGIVKKKEKRNPHAVGGVNDVSQVRSRKWTIAKSLKRSGAEKPRARFRPILRAACMPICSMVKSLTLSWAAY